MRHALLLLLIAPLAAQAVDIVDPTTDLRYATALRDLDLLQPMLQRTADDQVLLGQVAQCYVNLSLCGERFADGAYGPWLNYARQTAEHRRALRGGKPAATIVAAAPELWVDVLSGDAIGVVEVLKRYENERSSPAWQALMAMASRDPHVVTGDRLTPLQRIAWAEASLMIGDADAVRRLGFDEDLEPFVVAWLLNGANNPQRPEAMFGAIYASIVAQYARPDVDDATAVPALGSLVAAGGATAPAGADRAALLTLATRSAAAMRETDYHWLTASYPLCITLRGAPRTIDWKQPVLVTVGDLAAWNYERLYQAGLRALDRYDGRYQTIIRSLVQEAPDLVTARRMALSWNDQPSRDQDIIALASAIRGALEHEVEPADPTLVSAACAASDRLPEHSRDVVRKLVAEFARLPPWRQRPMLQRMAAAAINCGVGAPLGPAVLAAAARDPFDTELHRLKRAYDPAERLIDWSAMKPAATWIDPVIDRPALPWKETPATQFFAVRWDGAIDLPDAGTYEIATESDDGSRAAIGAAIIDNGGFHGPQRRSVEIAGGGPQPLHVDFFQADGGATCRLLWKPPGATELAAVPASALSHGEREAGLEASVVVLRDHHELDRALAPSAAECAFVRGIPHQAAMLGQVGDAFFRAGCYREAIPFFELAVHASDRARYHGKIGWCSLLMPDPDLDKGIAETVAGGYLPGDPDETFLLPWLTRAIQRDGRAPDMLARYGWHDWAANDNLVHGFLLLGTGDFDHARTCLRAVLKVLGLRISGDTWADTCLYEGLLSRMYEAREPDWTLTRRVMRHWRAPAYYLDAIDWIGGACTYEQAVAKQTSDEGRDALDYIRAIVDLTLGDHDRARTGLQREVSAHPQWTYTPLAQNLLAWYAAQTRDSLAKLPKARPLPTPEGAAPPATKHGDF